MAHMDVPTLPSIPSLTTSREISQYGAFKKSMASVSTNNHSIKIPSRHEHANMRKKLLMAPKECSISVAETHELREDKEAAEVPLANLKVKVELLPLLATINSSIPPEDYKEKAKKFGNLAALAESSHATEYVQEEIEVSGVLEKSNDFLKETLKKELPM